MSIDIFGALFTLSLSILNSERKGGAKYVNVRHRTPVTVEICSKNS